MCDTCGCQTSQTEVGKASNTHQHHTHDSDGKKKILSIQKDIMHSNNHQADHIREHLAREEIRSFNLMSSPGSGKTTLLERTIDALDARTIAVIEGDLETENDAQRIRQKGALSYQITTGTACHLDAFMVHDALHHLDLQGIRYLFVENVGNLVCPASFDVGTQKNIVMLSATEGDDKPEKYPVMFYKADLVLISKTEVARIMNFDMDRARQAIKKINPQVQIFTLSLDGNDQFDRWLDYLNNA